MLSTVDLPEALEEQYQANKELARDLVAALAGTGEERQIDAGVDLLSFEEPGYAYIDGTAYFKFYHSDRLLRMYSDGDIVPVGRRLVEPDARIICDFAADLVCFTPENVKAQLGASPDLLDKWLQYHETEQAIVFGLCARYARVDASPDIRLRRFKPGEVIISEGEPSSEVLCLIDGLAEVKSRDVTVGEIGPSEFFGEIGFLLNQNRTAAVTAKKTCTVQVIDSTEFVEFIKHNPHVIVTLATTLASRIVMLNDRVVTADNTQGRRGDDVRR